MKLEALHRTPVIKDIMPKLPMDEDYVIITESISFEPTDDYFAIGGKVFAEENEDCEVYNIYNDGIHIGMLAIEEFPDGINLEGLEIFKEYRKQGFGKKVVDLLKKKYKGIYVRAIPSAKKFWKKQGHQAYYNKSSGTYDGDLIYDFDESKLNENVVYRGYDKKYGVITHPDWIYVTEDLEQARYYASKDGSVKNGGVIEYDIDDNLYFLTLDEVNEYMSEYDEEYTLDDLLWYQQGLSDCLMNYGDGIKFQDPYFSNHTVYILFDTDYLKNGKEINLNEELIYESIKLVNKDYADTRLITTPQELNAYLQNNTESRVIYDKEKKWYIIGNPKTSIHYDMFRDAMVDGLYTMNDGFGRMMDGTKYEDGQNYYREHKDDFVIFRTTSDINNDEDFIYDDYRYSYEYKDYCVFDRNNDFPQTTLYQILGKPITVNYFGSEEDELDESIAYVSKKDLSDIILKNPTKRELRENNLTLCRCIEDSEGNWYFADMENMLHAYIVYELRDETSFPLFDGNDCYGIAYYNAESNEFWYNLNDYMYKKECIEQYNNSEYLRTTFPNARIIPNPWNNQVYDELYESVKYLNKEHCDTKIITSPFEMRDYIKNHKNIRIVYDALNQWYFVNDSMKAIHSQILDDAISAGYYDEYEVNSGNDILYSPYYEQFPLFVVSDNYIENWSGDGYENAYRYNSFVVYDRYGEFKETTLYQVLGNPLEKISMVGDELYEAVTPEQVPEKLYHATFSKLLRKIKKCGYLGNSPYKLWSDSNNKYVYLATDPDEAYSYAETALDDCDNERLYDMLEDDDIVILEIDTKYLDKNKIFRDENVVDGETTYQYEGIINCQIMKIYKPTLNESIEDNKKLNSKTNCKIVLKDGKTIYGHLLSVNENYVYINSNNGNRIKKNDIKELYMYYDCEVITKNGKTIYGNFVGDFGDHKLHLDDSFNRKGWAIKDEMIEKVNYKKVIKHTFDTDTLNESIVHAERSDDYYDDSEYQDMTNVILKNPSIKELIDNGMIECRIVKDYKDNFYFANSYEMIHTDIVDKLESKNITSVETNLFYDVNSNTFYYNVGHLADNEIKDFSEREEQMLRTSSYVSKTFKNFKFKLTYGEI